MIRRTVTFLFALLLLLPVATQARAQAQPIELDAVESNLTEAFSASFSGNGSKTIEKVDIRDDWGTLEISGQALDVLVYKQIPWPEFHYTLYQFTSRSADDLITGWIYCGDDGELQDIWYETTKSSSLNWEPVSGTCQTAQAGTPVAVHWPAMTLPLPSPIKGYVISGAEISLSAEGMGSWRDWDFIPYADVDCSTTCGSPGWYELHSLFMKPDSPDLCFGIVYLFTDGRPVIEAGADSICFPDLDSLKTEVVQASWSKS
jgi:hypothetical protein